MKTIHKYPVPVTNDQPFDVQMPKAAQLLHLGDQVLEGTQVWALVDTDMPMTTRRFQWFETGRDWEPLTPDDAYREYVGTIFHSQGAFVWHLFELRD